MTIKKAASYCTVLGFAAQSTRLRQSMDAKLLLMSDSAVRAMELDASSARDQAAAAEAEERSAADRTEGKELEERAGELRAKAEEDEALAAADAAAGEAAAARGAEDEAEAGVAVAKAAEDEVVHDADIAEGTAEAAAAAESESEALEDASAVAVCEFIPFLDVVCDVIGAAAEVGLETAAAAQAAESAAEFAAAAAVAADEEAELDRAAEAQAQATIYEEEATELEDKAAEEEQQAEAEQAEAELDEAKAETLFGKSTEEKVEAVEDEGYADAEAAESTSSWEESMSHGLGAFWDGLLSSFLSLFVFLYYGLRIFLQFLVHIPNAVGGGVPSTLDMGFCARMMSHVTVHTMSFLTAARTISAEWENLGAHSRLSKGGIVLCLAALAGLLHGILHGVESHHIHIVHSFRTGKCDSVNKKTGLLSSSCVIWWSVLSKFLFYAALFTIEALILLIVLRPHKFGSICLPKAHPVVPWSVFILYSVFHVWAFKAKCKCEESHGTGDDEEIKEVIMTENLSIHEKKEIEFVTSERQYLLPGVGSERNQSPDCEANDLTPSVSIECERRQEQSEAYPCIDITRTNDEAKRKFWRLQLPFEILMISCVVALLGSCIPKFHNLLPIFYKAFGSSALKWSFPLLTVGAISVSILFFWHAFKE